MADRTEQETAPAATLHMAISNAVVRLLREYTGRGPTKSRTTIRDNVVLVMLEQTLTKGEQSLVSKGRTDKVIEIRHEFQEAMREESMAKISELTGRNVTAMLSANHVNPDIGAEIFVLDGAPDYNELSAHALTDGTDDHGSSREAGLLAGHSRRNASRGAPSTRDPSADLRPLRSSQARGQARRFAAR